MAYTLRYYKTIPQPGECDILLQIYEKDGTRSAMEIGDVIQALHLDIQGSQDDIDTPIIKTSLTMTFVDAPDHADAGVMKCGDWQEFYTPDSTYWKVVLMARNASGSFTEIWGGYITPDSFSEQLRYRGSVTILARDNIGHMQDFPFDATGNEDGMITVYDLVNTAWAKIESPMRIDWRGTADSALWLQCDGTDAPSAYVNVSAFDGMNWYDAVEKVLYSMGMVMRYIGMNIVQVSSLRYMPNQGKESISDLPVIDPKFIAYASRELAPAVKRVEESSNYDLTDGKAAPLADGVAFSGVQGSSPFYSEDVFGEQTTFNIPVWPIANSGDLGWSNIPSSTLFLDPSRYSLSGDLVDDADRLIFLAGNTGDRRAVSYGLRMVCRDFRVDMKIGRVVERFNSTSLGYAWFVWAKQVRCYLSVEQNSATHFFTGTGWQTEAYLLNIDVVDGGISLDVPLADFSGSAIVKLTIQEIVLGWKIGDVSDGAGLYVAIESLKFTGAEGSLLKTNRVNTNYNESNNVIITRDPALSPAMNEVPFPQMIKNGIFVLQDSAYLPAKLWAWAWSGETPQQMAVYNHLQLLSYYAKPNNVITGDIVNANLGDIRAIYIWHGREHLLQGGSLNFLNGRIEGAILREFNRYEDLWGDVTGDAGLPDVESTSTTNAEAGSSSTSQNYDNTTEVYLSGSGGGGGSSTLAGLTDVRLDSLQGGHILVYDAASGKWVNRSGGAGGGSAALEVPVTADVAVGYIKKSYTLPEGMTFTEFVQMMFSQAIKKTLPSVTLGGVPTEAIEVGSEVTLSLSATYKDGQFVNTDEGVTQAGCEPGTPAYVLDGSTITIPHIFTASNAMMHSVTVAQPYGASTAEVKNSAGDVVDESIPAGIATASASFIVGYRAFWGYMTDDEAENLTSELVRGLEHRDTIIDPTKGKITLLQGDDTVPAGQDLMIAIPSSYILSEVVNKDDINFAENFVLSSLTVQCAGDAEASYNVYRFDNQSAYPMDIKKITIEEA